MTIKTKTCSCCKALLPFDSFYNAAATKDGKMYTCKDCCRAYRREYILPALRGRGKARVLPAWVQGLITEPVRIPAKVINIKDRLAVVGGKRRAQS